jgi:hypothetical protein
VTHRIGVREADVEDAAVGEVAGQVARVGRTGDRDAGPDWAELRHSDRV